MANIKQMNQLIFLSIENGVFKDFYMRVLYRIDGKYLREFTGVIIYQIDGEYIKDFYGLFLNQFDGKMFKPVSGGIKYFRSEAKLQRWMLTHNI